MCEGNATTATTSDASSSLPTAAATADDVIVLHDTLVNDGDVRSPPEFPVTNHHQQQHRARRSATTHNACPDRWNHHNQNVWDILPPLRSLEPPSSILQPTTDLVWKETLLQYQMTLQHMGTCILPNDVFSSLAAASSTTNANTTTNINNKNRATTTNDTHPFNSPPAATITTASISTNPVFVTISTATANDDDSSDVSYMIVGCHDGTICAWNLQQQLPALQQYYGSTGHPKAPPSRIPTSVNINSVTTMSAAEPNARHYSYDMDDQTPSTAISIDPIHVLDTLSPIQPCCILDTTTTTSKHAATSSLSSTLNDNTNITNSLCTIVQIYPISNHTLVVMNIVGMICMVQWTVASCVDSSRTNITPPRPNMIIPHMWYTGRLHPTSCCCSYSLDSIYIGYQSGHVECWSIPTSSLSSSPIAISIDSTSNPDDGNADLEQPSTLRWRGNFTNDHASPPPSIADMVPLRQQQQQNEHECLVISLHNDGHQRPNTSAMVEVIDVTSIVMAWNDDPSTNNDGAIRSLSLEDFVVLPEAGREILNVSPANQNPSSTKAANHWIQSRGTNCLLSSSTNATTSIETDDANVIALGHADGMITILDVTPTAADQSATLTPAWGVSNRHRRYCSLYPCIGMGHINLSETNHENNNDTSNMPQQYLACCLRGAATYLIPLQSTSRNDDAIVHALTVPHDMDVDVSIRYTQGFATCNIPVKRRCDTTIPPNNSGSLPLLAYVWPGGVIDVFSCGLLPHISASADVQLLKELIANGSVDALRELILSSSDDNNVMMKWTNVLHEIRRHGETTPIEINDILSDTFVSLRTELLSINQ